MKELRNEGIKRRLLGRRLKAKGIEELRIEDREAN
jgi:hypothetical protein